MVYIIGPQENSLKLSALKYFKNIFQLYDSQRLALIFLIIYCKTGNSQYSGSISSFGSSSGSNALGSNSYRSSGRIGAGSGNIIIPVGSIRHHPIEFKDFKIQAPEKSEPRVLEVAGGHFPLNIIFHPRSSQINIVDGGGRTGASHVGKIGGYSDAGGVQRTSSIEEPEVTFEEVNKPVYEELHQVIECVFTESKPYAGGSHDANEVSSVGNGIRKYNMC